MTQTNQPAQPGHNNPPSEIELLQERLQEAHTELCNAIDKRLANAAKVPKVCKDDVTAQKITDMISLIIKAKSAAQKAHKSEKEPFLTQGRFVDNFFNSMIKKLDEAAKTINRPLTAWQQQKVAAARAAAAEEAEKARLEAEQHNNAGAALEAEGMHAAAGVAFAESEAYERRADAMDLTSAAKPNQIVQTRTASGAVASLRTTMKGEVINRNELDLESLRPYFHIDDLNGALKRFIAAGGTELKGAKIYEDVKIGVTKRG
jgi:hypothetical protein